MNDGGKRTGRALRWAGWMVMVLAARAAADGLATFVQEAARLGSPAGLAVHLGCDGEAALVAELARTGKSLVHGLCLDPGAVGEARRRLHAAGVYGLASVEQAQLPALPYADNLVNLVVADDLPRLLQAGLSLGEVMRVLAPGGVALLGKLPGASGPALAEAELKAALAGAGIKDFQIITRDGPWARIVKPRPAGMDDWPCPTHSPDGNPVSKDELTVPTGLRWIAGAPSWPAGQRKTASPVMVAAGGRLFQVTPDRKGVQWLIARDAFNGLMQWKQPLFGAQAGPYPRIAKPMPVAWLNTQTPIGLVAVGEQVHAAAPKGVVAFDAATGRAGRSVDLKDAPDQLLHADGVLVAGTARQVWGISPAEGKVAWKADAVALDIVLGGGSVFYLDLANRLNELVCLEPASGAPRWRANLNEVWPEKASVNPKADRCFRLLLHQRGVLFVQDLNTRYVKYKEETYAFRRTLAGISAADGKVLWHRKYEEHSHRQSLSGSTVFFVNDLAWIETGGENNTMVWLGLDPASGQVRKTLRHNFVPLKCQRDVATERFFIHGRYLNFVDWRDGSMVNYLGVRGGCQVGVIPANGLLYAAPEGCGCSEVSIRGLKAVGPGAGGKDDGGPGSFEKGPAYGTEVKPDGPDPGDWPTLRHDDRRSGGTPVAVPADLDLLWESPLAAEQRNFCRDDWDTSPQMGGPLSAPVVAGDVAYVAVPNEHRVVAVDASTGRVTWTFTAGGRVDSPPTIHRGLCLFGSRDGWVYCLRASDGALAWRSRAGSADRRILAFGQLESPWPVPGSVLARDGVAYFSAGRSSHSDGGIVVRALDAATGREIWSRRPATIPKTSYVGHALPLKGFASANDVLVGDEAAVYLKGWRFDRKSGGDGAAPPAARPTCLATGREGLIDASWSRYTNASREGQIALGVVSANELVFDEKMCYGYLINHSRNSGRISSGVLFAQDPGKKDVPGDYWREDVRAKHFTWSRPMEKPDVTQIEAMVLAGETLFAAGPLDRHDSARGGFLWAISTSDGRQLREIRLPSGPIARGMAAARLSTPQAAGGRLFVPGTDGRLRCFGKR